MWSVFSMVDSLVRRIDSPDSTNVLVVRASISEQRGGVIYNYLNLTYPCPLFLLFHELLSIQIANPIPRGMGTIYTY